MIIKNYRKIYEQHHGPIPKDENGRTYDIHHIDGNRSNNDLNNLIALSIRDHYDIHYSRGDYGAAWLIARKMNMTAEELSNISRLSALKQVIEGKHPFTSENTKTWQQSLVKSGKHHWLGGEIQRKSNQERLLNGTHHLLDSKGSKNFAYDSTVYEFTKDEMIEKCTPYELVQRYPYIHRGNLSQMTSGYRKSCNGWKIQGERT
jgi:hypothetical protein